MKKSVIFLLFFYVLSFSFAWAQAPKHYVFLVHGVASTPAGFGHMEKNLREEAKTLDPHTDWQFISFAYETGNDSKNVVIFARELSDFIAEKFKKAGGLQSQDKFSLVMYSQGGLVGINFLLRSYLGKSSFHPELGDHLDAFITMATPYWGAKIAIFGNRMLPILSYLKIPLSDKFGKEELKDMELVSDFSGEMRKMLIAPENQVAIKKLKERARFLVFSGVTERLNLLTPLAGGKYRYEDDTAVPIPSSRLDFLYYTDSKERSDNVVEVRDFKETSIVDKDNYVVVNAFHASPFPQNIKFPGISHLPDRCVGIAYRDCKHPTFPGLVQHLFNLPKDPPFVRDLTSFAIDLKVNSMGASIDRKKMSISFESLSYGLTIGKDSELYNKVTRWTKNGNYRMYHTGYIDPKKTTSTIGKIGIVISAPGFIERKIIAPVRTTMSTFIEINLQKKDE